MNFGTANTPAAIFGSPFAQLGGLNPFLALAAINPVASLAAKSPTLNIFNPALNPSAALLAFNPAAAPALSLSSVVGPATLPFASKAFFNPFRFVI